MNGSLRLWRFFVYISRNGKEFSASVSLQKRDLYRELTIQVSLAFDTSHVSSRYKSRF